MGSEVLCSFGSLDCTCHGSLCRMPWPAHQEMQKDSRGNWSVEASDTMQVGRERGIHALNTRARITPAWT